MARETTITIEQVSAVALKLQAQGVKPTSRAVHAQIGYGSMGTILKLLQQWQSNQSNQSKVIENSIDPAIASAINNTLATRVQDATAEVTIKLANLQIETDNLIRENERQFDVIESQLIEQSELQAQNATMAGRIQQIEIEANKTIAELSAERQTSEALRIALAKAELRLEVIPKIELEITKLRTEVDALKIQAATSHESEAVALAKMEAAQQAAQESRDNAMKSVDATEAIRDKYEQLLAVALDKERANAKLLEGEHLKYQSQQLAQESALESAMRDTKDSDNKLKETQTVNLQLNKKIAMLITQQNQMKITSEDPEVLSFNQNDTSQFDELEELVVF